MIVAETAGAHAITEGINYQPWLAGIALIISLGALGVALRQS